MTTQSETIEAMKYNQGDEITIMRGIHRGKTAKVLGVDAAKRQYATQLTDGQFVVINEVNTKAPQEGQVQASRLATLVKTWADSDGDVDHLVSLLSENVDGFAKAYGTDTPA